MKKQAFAKNVEVLGYNDLEGRPGFQMAMQIVDGRYYLYLAHFKHCGWTILDVTDPTDIKYLKWVPGPDKPGQVTLKIQVADGVMITALQQGISFLHGNAPDDPFDEGVYIWDVKDPVDPKFLSHFQTGGSLGVHRFFYNGGRYMHLTAAAPGFLGYIYRIVDIADPKHPVEAGRWWIPEQWTAGQMPRPEPPWSEILDGPNLHGPAYPKGDLAYLSYGGAGLKILDISDVSLPRLVGELHHHPPFSGKHSGARCHTILPLSDRPYAVMTTEGERYTMFNKDIVKGVAQPLNFLGMVDVSDPSDPTLISTFPYPEIPAGWPWKNFNEMPGGGNGPMGPHNIHEPHDHPALEDRTDRVYCCYFHAGLRIYDISDPYVPREIAYYIPEDPDKWAYNNATGDLHLGTNISITEDVLVDDRGNIFVDTLHQGVFALRCTV